MRRAMGHWSGLRVLALLVAALGTYGVVSSALGIIKKPPTISLVSNPVLHSRLRGEPAQALQNLVKQYPGNFATVALFSLLMLALGVHFTGLLRDLHRHRPVAALVAGLLLGSSLLCGLLVGLSVIKLSEFAVQASSASAEQQVWLRGGMSFLMQLHLIFVAGWELCTGLGWVIVGAAALRAPLSSHWLRSAGVVELLAGLALVATVMARAWLPIYGESASGLVVFLSGREDIGMSWGFLASGVLAWSHFGATPTRMPSHAG